MVPDRIQNFKYFKNILFTKENWVQQKRKVVTKI